MPSSRSASAKSHSAKGSVPRALHAATLTTSKARAGFSELVSRTAFGKERVVLMRNGRPAVAVIPVEDLALLEEFEDARDLLLAKKAEAEASRKRQKPVPWTEAKKKLGLKEIAPLKRART